MHWETKECFISMFALLQHPGTNQQYLEVCLHTWSYRSQHIMKILFLIQIFQSNLPSKFKKLKFTELVLADS